jgi:hypothetical protein
MFPNNVDIVKPPAGLDQINRPVSHDLVGNGDIPGTGEQRARFARVNVMARIVH